MMGLGRKLVISKSKANKFPRKQGNPLQISSNGYVPENVSNRTAGSHHSLLKLIQVAVLMSHFVRSSGLLATNHQTS